MKNSAARVSDLAAAIKDRAAATDFAKLQALVYGILPPSGQILRTGLGKLPANCPFFLGAQNGSKFVTDNWN